MAKCRALSPEGIKCNRFLVDCLRDGLHVGRRWRKKPVPGYLNVSWHWDITKVVLLPAWQPALKSEVRRLDYLCKDAAEYRNPVMYRRMREARSLAASFVVRERVNKHGVRTRVVKTNGLVRPIGQAVLE